MDESNKRSRLGWILVIIGAIFLARNLDVFDFSIPYYLTSWQMILIAIGIVLLFTNSNKGSGISLILIGGFFLITDIYDVDFQTYWPLILVIIGIAFIIGRRRSLQGTEYDKDQIDEMAILGGGDRIITSENFQGGRITTLLGGMDIDMRKAKLASGHHKIDVFAMFGGMEIKLPEDWPVKVSVVAVLGGFSDERSQPKAPDGSNNHLEIKGFVMFGGGTIKN